MQHSACCSPHLLQSSFYYGIFFPSAFYAEIQGARAPEHLVLSQDPAAGFFWIAGTLTNSRLMLDEKYNLHCWLSPVTDTWRGFGWNFVLKKILAWKLILHCVDVPGKAEPALLALRCVLTSRNISWNKSPCPPPSWGSPRLPAGAPVGVMECFPDALGVSHSALRKERSHLFPF